MKENLRKEIEVPEGVTVQIIDSVLTVKSSQGEVVRDFNYPTLDVSIEDNKIIIIANNATKREKRMCGTFESHIKNMVKGVQEKYVYKLKICSGHFPMNVSVSGDSIVVKNFLGEKHPRKVIFPQSVIVKVNGQEVEVTSCSKETSGQIAASIERMCRITNKDLRIFQDGIYIVSKGN